MSSLPVRTRRPSFIAGSLLTAIALAAVSWWYILTAENARLGELFSDRTWDFATQFLREMAGIGTPSTPAYLDIARWAEVAALSYQTLAMSVLAAGLATIGMLITVIPAARTAATGELTLSRSPAWPALFLIIRGTYIFSRAVPELIWALVIIFVFSPGILPGALALAVHNFGILGKLCAEVIEDIDRRPIRALRTAGAGRLQILLYGVLPQALPQFLTYILYRWEVIIRTTIVVGFVSAAGLGREFRLSLSFFHYTDITLILIAYLILVFMVDGISTGLRRLAR